ncbi:MAG: hypothetical protein CMN58_00420 [Solibacterales bacterium]|nr:hypothetical protein [Bryobacterales bacterium]
MGDFAVTLAEKCFKVAVRLSTTLDNLVPYICRVFCCFYILITLGSSQGGTQIEFVHGDDQIKIRLDGRDFSTFYFGRDVPKPFLHPLRTIDGIVATRSFPMEKIPGEVRDHSHHRGVWFAHGDVNGYDFWANEFESKAENKGQIVLQSIRHTTELSSKRGTIEATFEWRSPKGKLLLTENRTMTFHVGSPNRVVDFDFVLTATDQKVRFGDTKEGTFGIRVATELEEARVGTTGILRTGRIQSAEHKIGELEVWGKRSRWVDYSGSIAGKTLGIAILDHPDNPRHPTYWHVRSYGLFAANIFGQHDFHADPKRDASLTLKPHTALRFRYRVVLHPGDTEAANVQGLYNRYISE